MITWALHCTCYKACANPTPSLIQHPPPPHLTRSISLTAISHLSNHDGQDLDPFCCVCACWLHRTGRCGPQDYRRVSTLHCAHHTRGITLIFCLGLWHSVVNNCAKTANPWVADTSCTYSPARCGKTNPYTGPTSHSVAAGGNAVFTLPNNVRTAKYKLPRHSQIEFLCSAQFVGRVFDRASSSACGSDGWDCSLLE